MRKVMEVFGMRMMMVVKTTSSTYELLECFGELYRVVFAAFGFIAGHVVL